MELNDILMIGRKFTWYSVSGTDMSRLDRVLLSNYWLNKWPDSSQYILDRPISDHCAIVLKHKIIDWGLTPFRALDVWRTHVEFFERVSKLW